MGYRRLLVPAALVLLSAGWLSAQAVISVHSGVVHFSEGTVFIDDQPVNQKFAAFPSVKEGSTLRTEDGRAEVLLTPGVLLRVDQNSSVRMVSTSLTDTKVEFLKGSVIIDSTQASSGSPVVILDKESQIRFSKSGSYRIDFEPALLQVYSGEAEVTRDGKPTTVDNSHLYFLNMGLDTKKVGNGEADEFYQWSNSRSQTDTADDKLAAQIPDDPAKANSDEDDDDLSAATPSPLIGIPGYSLPGGIPGPRPLNGLGTYGSLGPGLGVPLSSTLFDPYAPFAMSAGLYPYSPFGFAGYPGYPMTVIPLYLRGYRHTYNPLNPTWRHRVGYPYPPVRVGISRGTIPLQTIPRPLFPNRSTVGVGAYRGVGPSAPHVVAPARPTVVGPHAGFGHR